MNKITASVLIIITILFSLIFIVRPVLADEKNNTATSSYELFWPLVAGKTADDPLYFLKLFKEQVRGWLIFGAAQKADFQMMLSTKRVLEAEKLLQRGRDDLAIKTLDKAISQISSARTNLDKAQKSGKGFQPIKTNLINQLANLNNFLPNLAAQSSSDVQVRANETKKTVEQFLGTLQ